MLRKITLLLSLVMTFALASSAVAQTPTTDDPVEALNEIASEVTLYGRSFEADITAATPEAESGAPMMAIVQAYVFEDADVAEEARPYVEQLMKETLEPIIGQELITEEVDDLGDNASLSQVEVENSGESASLSLYIVQQEEVIFISASAALNGDSEPLANDLVMFMLDAEPGDADAVEFNEDGTSTGGYFDTFPVDSEHADVLQGLMVTEDMYEVGN